MSKNQLKQKNKVFINSLPKSGTHLLAKAIEIFGYQEHLNAPLDIENNSQSEIPEFLDYQGIMKVLKKEQIISDIENTREKINVGAAVSGFYIKTSIFKGWLNAIKPNFYILGHIPKAQILSNILTETNYHHLLIIRDPRAVFVSTYLFVFDTRKIGGKHLLKDDLAPMSETERFNFLLKGGYAKEAGVTIKSFAERYRSMLAWRDEPGCLFLRFEDLVGEGGGGSNEKQKEVVKKIALHLGVSFDDQISAKLKEIYNPDSRTFRTGKIDGWKNSLDQKIIEHLIEYCQPLCQEAGYDL